MTAKGATARLESCATSDDFAYAILACHETVVLFHLWRVVFRRRDRLLNVDFSILYGVLDDGIIFIIELPLFPLSHFVLSLFDQLLEGVHQQFSDIGLLKIDNFDRAR